MGACARVKGRPHSNPKSRLQTPAKAPARFCRDDEPRPHISAYHSCRQREGLAASSAEGKNRDENFSRSPS